MRYFARITTVFGVGALPLITLAQEAAKEYTVLAPLDGVLQGETIVPELGSYLNTLFRGGVMIAGALAVIMITIGGIQYMSSDAVYNKGEGKEKIKAALLGLLIAVAAVTILQQINPQLIGILNKDEIEKAKVEGVDLKQTKVGEFGLAGPEGEEGFAGQINGRLPNSPDINTFSDIASGNIDPHAGSPPPAKSSSLQVGQSTTLRNTVYYASSEFDHLGKPKNSAFHLTDGTSISANSEFVRLASIEGTAILADGRTLNVVMNKNRQISGWKVTPHRYGLGNYNNPLIPFKSVAIDPKVIASGSTLFIPSTVGMSYPGGTHNGIWYAHDVGGAIKNDRIDLFGGVGSSSQQIFRSHGILGNGKQPLEVEILARP